MYTDGLSGARIRAETGTAPDLHDLRICNGTTNL